MGLQVPEIKRTTAALHGTGVPSNSLGTNGDTYFREEPSGVTVYAKAAGAWVVKGVLPAADSVVTRAQVNVNVKSYGAVGDGVTDDFQAIQDAITAAGTNGSVFAPAGTYLLGKAAGGGLKLPAGATSFTFYGAGKATVLKLTKEVPRAFDFYYTATDLLYKNIVLRDFDVDANSLLGTDVGPLTTVAAGTIAGSSAYTTIDVGSTASWASAGAVWFPTTNTGTAAGVGMAYTVTSSTTIRVRNDGSAKTLLTSDQVQGCISDHVICGTWFARATAAAWNMSFDNIRVENVTAKNVSCEAVSGLTNRSPTERWGVMIQPTVGTSPAPSATQYVKNVVCRNVRVEGGQYGLFVGGAIGGGNIFTDDVLYEDCYHNVGTTPSFNYACANFHVGGGSWVGRVILRRCRGFNSGDVGVEVNQAMVAIHDDVVIEDAWVGFYHQQFTEPAPSTAGPPATTMTTASINSSDATMAVTAIPAGVAQKGWLRMGTEIMRYVRSGSTLTLSIYRGDNASTPASHTAGDAVTFIEVEKQQIVYRDCQYRNFNITPSGTAGVGWGRYTGSSDGYRPGPPIRFEGDCAHIRKGTWYGLTGEAILIQGYNPRIEGDLRINVQGIDKSDAAVSHTLVYWDRGADAQSSPNADLALEIRRLRIRADVGGKFTSTGAGCTLYVHRPGRGDFDMDMDIDARLHLAGITATGTKVVRLTPATGLAGFKGRIGVRLDSSAGDAAPFPFTVGATSAALIRGRLDVELDLRKMVFSASSSDANYHPWSVDTTNYAQVHIRKHLPSQSCALSYPTVPMHAPAQKSSAYTVTPDDKFVPVNSSGGAVVITLPKITSSAEGSPHLGIDVLIVDVGGSNANFTVVTTSPDTYYDATTTKTATAAKGAGFRVTSTRDGFWSITRADTSS